MIYCLLILVAGLLWLILSRVNRLYATVRELIHFVAGLVENLKKDEKFSRESEEYALENIYRIWRLLDRIPDARLKNGVVSRIGRG